jgi:hypothetical protein
VDLVKIVTAYPNCVEIGYPDPEAIIYNRSLMGCGGSKHGMIPGGKGVFPVKLDPTKVKANVEVHETVYLFGGKKILQYNRKDNKISEVQASVVLPKRTQCEFLSAANRIATLGGTNPDKSLSKAGFLFAPPNFNDAVKLPDFPVPIRYTTLAYHAGVLYSIGGETDGADPANLLKDVYCLTVGNDGKVGAAWEKFCELDIPRRSANVLVSEGNIFVFAGYAGKGNRTTQVDRISIAEKKTTKEAFRLPLGVEGARTAWFGGNILYVGGKRIGETPERNCLLLNFKKKGILSVRWAALYSET